MTQRRPLTDAELEALLFEVGRDLAYPAPRDLLPAVRARIASAQPGFWQQLWSPRLAAVPALATVALLLAAVLAFQPVAATAAEALGLRGIGIFRGPAPTATPRLATPSPSSLFGRAQRVPSVAAAERESGMQVLVPAALGAPDEVYVDRSGPVNIVYLAYGPRSGIPTSAQTGLSVVVMEARGFYDQRFLGKFLGPESKAEPLTVNGQSGVWIEGAPHQFFFVALNGDIVPDTVRLAGNVLIWDQSGMFLRIEAQIRKDEALRIAASLR